MIGNITQRRSTNGLAISPLVVVAAILAGLVLVEGLLLARFWIQLTAFSTGAGISATVLEVTQPLVAPFADARATLESSVGTFERGTLFAALVYLLAAVCLVAATMTIGGALEAMHRLSPRTAPRGVIATQYSPMASSRTSQLQTTAYVNLSPNQTARALRMLRLDRLEAELVIIPAQGGCIVAAFTDESLSTRWPIIGRVTHARQNLVLNRSLHALSERFVPAGSRPVTAGN